MDHFFNNSQTITNEYCSCPYFFYGSSMFVEFMVATLVHKNRSLSYKDLWLVNWVNGDTLHLWLVELVLLMGRDCGDLREFIGVQGAGQQSSYAGTTRKQTSW